MPYRLPEILEAIANQHPIFVVEGEKDADSLWKIGVPATCNAGGSNKWKPALNDHFRDAQVVVLPDRDVPGWDHAQDVARQLADIAASVRVLLLPELPEKGDVSDWLEAGRTAEELNRLAEEAQSWSGMQPCPWTDPDQTSAPGDDDSFETDNNGKTYSNSQKNIRVALRRLGVRVRHDQFQDRLLIEGMDGIGPLLDDRAIERLWLEIDQRFRFRPSKDFFLTVVSVEARLNPFHPVRKFLDGLRWNGVERIDKWLTTYAGAADTAYTNAVGALLLVAACRRIRSPGCKFDEMVVLESEQGTEKSSALAALAVQDDWFSDDLPLNADGKRVIEALSGRWIIEAAELKGMRKGEIQHLKAFLSRRFDRARMSYDRLVTEVPRQCVIVGTTNSEQYLKDITGNRRFWPVRIKKFDLASLAGDRDQLWAEAAAREAKGIPIRLDPLLWEAAAREQELRVVEDPFSEVIEHTLGSMEGKIAAADVWLIVGVREGQRNQEHNSRLGEAMRQLGWKRERLRFGRPNKEYGYWRGTKDKQIYVSRDVVEGTVSAFYEQRGEEDGSNSAPPERLAKSGDRLPF